MDKKNVMVHTGTVYYIVCMLIKFTDILIPAIIAALEGNQDNFYRNANEVKIFLGAERTKWTPKK